MLHRGLGDRVGIWRSDKSEQLVHQPKAGRNHSAAQKSRYSRPTPAIAHSPTTKVRGVSAAVRSLERPKKQRLSIWGLLCSVVLIVAAGAGVFSMEVQSDV